ncbi:hypothetical protein CQA53_06325 [Helicobacter didelphidarum]|uniref:Uncharacterized protein n=1 Tax=Helicobacter didelphidarum TaxID=2040648 RepID=A0A3D8IKH8_9HELI|nr:hypothetical protein [Helicobacter didelphidarum]RDU65386.1 hypothetical protein CQA53_06325 [Helicobacter didelphidarum]
MKITRFFYIIVFFSYSVMLLAKESVYEYAITQTQEISPAIKCQGDNVKAMCNVQNVEWIEGVLVKNFEFNVLLNKNVLKKTRSYTLETKDLNFEGYNLSSLMPQSILCTDFSELKKSKDIKQNVLLVNLSCNLHSNVYEIEIDADFKTFHTLYNQVNTTLEALNREHELFIQPLAEKQEDWKNKYFIQIKKATLRLKSYSLHTILFDLYKREQRIAQNENSQNDKNYRTIQDSALFEDYLSFLQNSYQISGNIKTDSKITKDNEQALSKLVSTFIDIATKPDQSLFLQIVGNNTFKLSLDEIEDIMDINELFVNVIIKILENTQMQVIQNYDSKA